jgi:SAM-dependent methyltransferase
MFRQESYYWWHIGKRRLVRRLIEKYRTGEKLYVLELGCGTGKLLSELQESGLRVLGLDFSQVSLSYCIRRDVKNLGRADFKYPLPIKEKSVDIVICLDVIEHEKNDLDFVREIHSILKPGGIAIFTVPAYQALWSYWDEALGHKRRYNGKSFRVLIDQTPLNILRIGYFNTFVFFPVVLWRSIKGLFVTAETSSSDFVEFPKWINYLMIQLNRVEVKIIELGGLAFGLSLFSVAKREEND